MRGAMPAATEDSPLLDAARKRLFAAMEERAVPCVRLSSVKDGAPVRSCLGGLPAIGGRFEWPHWRGRPLSFVANIELAEIAAALKFDWLPDSGRLLFFYDSEHDAWGFDPNDRGAWAVYFDASEQPAPPLEPPPELPEHARFPELPMAATAASSFPSIERLEGLTRDLPDADWDALADRHPVPSPAHQLGGFPTPIQGDEMELECQLASNGLNVGGSQPYDLARAEELRTGSEDWLLLLQVDSDDDADMMWGDAGMLYFWVRRQDAASKDFSKVWMVLQCF